MSLGRGLGGGWRSFFHMSAGLFLASGPRGAGGQPKTPLLPWAGQRRSQSHRSDTAEPQNIVSSPGPVRFEGTHWQELTLRPTGTRACGRALRPWPHRVLTKQGSSGRSEGRRWCKRLQGGTKQR